MTDDSDAERPAHRLTIRPDDLVLEVRHREVPMAAANRVGLYWPTACDGIANCTRCYFEVEPPFTDAFEPLTPLELAGLRQIRWRSGDRDNERLACQARMIGDAEIRKKYVRAATEYDSLPMSAGSTS